MSPADRAIRKRMLSYHSGNPDWIDAFTGYKWKRPPSGGLPGSESSHPLRNAG
jgi:hypothetical protein